MMATTYMAVWTLTMNHRTRHNKKQHRKNKLQSEVPRKRSIVMKLMILKVKIVMSKVMIRCNLQNHCIRLNQKLH